MRTLVLIESPYAADKSLPDEMRRTILARNLHYARTAMHDAFVKRNEYPWCSHLVYTQPGILDDNDEAQRALGIEAGLAWGQHAALTAVYADFGVSRGMVLGIAAAQQAGRPVVWRYLLERPVSL